MMLSSAMGLVPTPKHSVSDTGLISFTFVLESEERGERTNAGEWLGSSRERRRQEVAFTSEFSLAT